MKIQAKARISLELNSAAGLEHSPRYDLTLDLKDGRYEDTALPWPVDKVAGHVRIQDGRIAVERLTARLGHAQAEVSLRSLPGLLDDPITPTRRYGPQIRALAMDEALRPHWWRGAAPTPVCGTDPLQEAERLLERFEIHLTGLSLDDDLFARLTPKANRIREMFNPQGGVNITLRYQRSDADQTWRREVEVKPNKLSIEYEKFRYRVHELAGSLKKVIASDGTDEFQVNMIGSLGGRRVDISGKVAGEGPDPFIAVRIAGSDIPVDDQLFAALPGNYSEGLKKLRASARGDFIVDIRQNYQVNRAENTFNIRVYNGSVNYTHFPYPFKQVRGTILIRSTVSDPCRPLRPGLVEGSAGPNSTRVELKNFEAVHDGGRIWLSGENDAVPGSDDRKMSLRVQGENCPIDEDFRKGLRELKLDGALNTFAPKERSPSEPMWNFGIAARVRVRRQHQS